MSDETVKSENDEITDLDLEGFQNPDDQHGLSLDELSEAYASLMDAGDDPYAENPLAEEDDSAASDEDPQDSVLEETKKEADDSFEVSPRSIIESMFFVGTPDNSPLTAKQVASLMRGVRPQEVDELVDELNAAYDAENCPFRIVSSGPGYQMTLRDDYAALRNQFYGKVKDAKLSQAAVDVLAVVAYNQPLSRVEVDELRGKPSGGLLNQLVRRQLLNITRSESKPRTARYTTTDRFLSLFGLDSISDLPRSQDLDRPA